MAVRIRAARAGFTVTHAQLNRARRLFMWFMRHEIEDLITLEMVADAMIYHGLYWPGATTHGVAYSIIKRLYRLYFGHLPMDYHEPLKHWWAWMERFQWCGRTHEWNDDRHKAAAKIYPFKKLPWQR